MARWRLLHMAEWIGGIAGVWTLLPVAVAASHLEQAAVGGLQGRLVRSYPLGRAASVPAKANRSRRVIEAPARLSCGNVE